MADLFTRLARRTLAHDQQLSIRLPSRYEPRRSIGIEVDDRSSDESALSQNAPPFSGTATVAARCAMDDTLPGRESNVPPAGKTTGDQATDTTPAPALAAAGKRHADASDRVEPLVDSTVEEGRSSRSHRHDLPSDRFEGETPRRPSALDRIRPETSPASAEEARPESEAGSQAPSTGAASETARPISRHEEAASFEERLSPLMHRQPGSTAMTGRAADSAIAVRGGVREQPTPPPAVEVTIGSIEVRAVTPPTPPSPSRPEPTLTLDDYLKRRDEGGS